MISQNEIDYMNECTSRDILIMLTENKNLNMEDAMSVWYNSKTFSKLKDTRTTLYYQSPIYVYDVLDDELTHRNTL